MMDALKWWAEFFALSDPWYEENEPEEDQKT